MNLFQTCSLIVLYVLTGLSCAVAEDHPVVLLPSQGTITEQYRSVASDKLIIYIQDVHCNASVQNNISAILTALRAVYPEYCIGIEGAAGSIDAQIYRSVPDEIAREKVCSGFIKKGILTGVEKYVIAAQSAEGISLFGLEHPQLFLDNLGQFRQTIRSSGESGVLVFQLEDAIGKADQAAYPHALQEFQRHAREWQDGTIGVTQWIEYLSGQSEKLGVSLDEYPALTSMADLSQSEQGFSDNAVLQQERSRLMTDLKNRLAPQDFMRAAKYILEFETDRITPDVFVELMDGFDVKWSADYPATHRLIRYLTQKQNLGSMAIFDELESLEFSLREGLIEQTVVGENAADTAVRKELCRVLYTLTTQLERYKKLLGLRMNDNELSEYFQERHTLSPAEMMALLERVHTYYALPIDSQFNAVLAAKLTVALDRARLFYTTADRRSAVMAENILQKMDSDNYQTAVVVAGGFHARVMLESLRARDVSYITITPAVEPGGINTYLPLMMQPALDALQVSGAAASYIPFPVLLGLVTADAPYFEQLRTNLARGLLTYSGTTVAEYRRQISNDIQRKLFDKLVMLAQMDLQYIESASIQALLNDLSPVSAVEYILGFTDQRIDAELYAAGFEQNTITAEAREVFGRYLLGLLSLAVQIDTGEFGETFYLRSLLQNSRDIRYTTVRSVVQKKLENGLDAESVTAETFQSYDDTVILELAQRVVRGVVDQHDDRIFDWMNPAQIVIENRENPVTILRNGQRYPQLSFTISLPYTDGTRRTYRIRGGTPEQSQDAGVRVFTATNPIAPKYYRVEQELGQFTHFYLNESTAEQSAADIDPAGKNASLFAASLGAAAAQANFFGVTGRALDDLRVVEQQDGTLRAVFADYYDTLSLRGQSPLELLAPMVDFITIARRSGIGEDAQRGLMSAFIEGFKIESSNIQDHFFNNRKDYRRIAGLAGLPGWNAVLERQDETLNDPNAYLDTFITDFNTRYNLGFYDDTVLRQIARDILANLKQTGKLDVADDITPEDIQIANRSRAGMIAQGDRDENQLRLLFSAAIPDGAGAVKKYFIKSALPRDGDMLGIEALRVLGRDPYFYGFSDVTSGGITGFHVTENVGAHPLYHYQTNTEYNHLLAPLIGEAVAEAYMIGIYDRNDINARVVVDRNGVPQRVVNIDLETAVTQGHSDMDTILMATIFFEDASQKGVPFEQMYDWGVAFLQSFYTTMQDMQQYAVQHRTELETNPVLAGNPFWENALERLDPERTDVLDVVLQASALVAQEVVGSLAYQLLMTLQKSGNVELPDWLEVSELSIHLINVDRLFMHWYGDVFEEQAIFSAAITLADNKRRSFTFYGIMDDIGLQENTPYVGENYSGYFVRFPVNGFVGFFVREYFSVPDAVVTLESEQPLDTADFGDSLLDTQESGAGVLVAQSAQTAVQQNRVTIAEAAQIYQFLAQVGLSGHTELADSIQDILIAFSDGPVNPDDYLSVLHQDTTSLFYAAYQEQLKTPLFNMLYAMPRRRVSIINIVPFLLTVQNMVIDYVAQLPVGRAEAPLLNTIRLQQELERSL